MKRYLSFSKSSGLRGEDTVSLAYPPDKTTVSDGASIQESFAAPTIKPDLPSPNFEVKKVDHFFSKWSNKWKYRDSSSKVIPELRPLPVAENGREDVWRQYCFVVIREIPHVNAGKDAISGSAGVTKPYFRVVVKSSYLRKACKDVLGQIIGLSWNEDPLELDPHLLLTFLPYFQLYRDDIQVKERDSEESYVHSTVGVLMDYLRKDYRATLASLENLTSHGEITFDLLFAILVPRSIIVTTARTGEVEALQLVSAAKTEGGWYSLMCEGIGVSEQGDTYRPGMVPRQITIPYFEGTVKIDSLVAYPLLYHPHEEETRRALIARGRKWASLSDGKIHHMQYRGTAILKTSESDTVKWNVNSRVIIDRDNCKRRSLGWVFPKTGSNDRPFPPNDTRCSRDRHGLQSPEPSTQERRKEEWRLEDLTDDELLITSQAVWGFSLSDKTWLEFNVEYLSPIEWNETAFFNLVLPPDRKMLLQSLIEGHNADLGFDDFIKGKGQGLVVNFFGPPGVGKTLSAEATSEHVKRPLYIVGASDLGTTASQLDGSLQRVFELAGAWKAIVLIDEADVFLEERSLHDLERNAMVAVFLRHLEYYPAILFLTTNRVKTFDPALLSRIHIALHFQEFSTKAREQVWVAFLDKVGIKIGPVGGVSEEELKKLGERDINGRQVKNATKTAQCLAVSRGERLQYKHLIEVLDVVEQFSVDFGNMRNEGV